MVVHRKKRYKKSSDSRRSEGRLGKGGGKEGGEVGLLLHPSFYPFTSSSSVCLEFCVIFNPVKDNSGLQTHKGSGEKD